MGQLINVGVAFLIGLLVGAVLVNSVYQVPETVKAEMGGYCPECKRAFSNSSDSYSLKPAYEPKDEEILVPGKNGKLRWRKR